MKKIVLFALLFSVSFSSLQSQDFSFEEPVPLFDHPLQSPGFDFPFIPLDYNYDGKQDYLGRFPDGEIRVFITNNFDDYDLSVDLNINYFSRPFDVMDFNNDGYDDLIMEGFVRIYNPFSESYDELICDPEALVQVISVVGVADFDGDGNNDLLTTKGFTSSPVDFAIYYWDGGFSFERELIPFDLKLGPIRIGDLEGDGDTDIAVIDKFDNQSPKILVNDGTGNFTQRFVNAGMILKNTALDFDDLDGDGDLDILANNIDNQQVIFENTDNFQTSVTQFEIVGNSPYLSKVMDLNNDGKKEIVSLFSNSGTFVLSLLVAEEPLEYELEANLAILNGSPVIVSYNPNYLKNSIYFTDADNDGNTDVLLTFGPTADPKVYLIKNTSPVSIFEKEKLPLSNLSVYPNPVSGTLNLVENNRISQGVDFSIINSLGQIVDQNIIDGNGIDVSHLNNGQYILNVFNEKEIFYSKFQVLK